MSINDKMMDSMMESMIGKMTAEEKSLLMNKIMESFFSNMTDEEKQAMMKELMPKMTMGGGGNFNMMEMMGPMMSAMMGGGNNSGGQGFNMMEMCRQMMSCMTPSNPSNASASGIKAIFEEWLEQIEKEVIEFTKESNSMDPDLIAAHFKISRESAEYIISRIQQKQKAI